MDIYINATVLECEKVFVDAGFNIENQNGYTDAVMKTDSGRYHIHFTRLGNVVYADLHFDYLIHFMFLGVYYQKYVLPLFEQKIEPLLKANNVPYNITASTWFHRRNRAILWGMKV